MFLILLFIGCDLNNKNEVFSCDQTDSGGNLDFKEQERTLQIHLDFYNSKSIEEVGANFDKKQFQESLIAGNVNSSIFSQKGITDGVITLQRLETCIQILILNINLKQKIN
jgi:hypothetical protein